MVDCCELALHNARLTLYIALGAFVVISLLLAMFFGYNLKLSARTASLEKKNGKELAKLEQVEKRLVKLEKNNHA